MKKYARMHYQLKPASKDILAIILKPQIFETASKTRRVLSYTRFQSGWKKNII